MDNTAQNESNADSKQVSKVVKSELYHIWKKARIMYDMMQDDSELEDWVKNKIRESYEALDGMVDHVKDILKELKLPYRILRLCGGDTSFASALTYDFEVFSTAQDRWLEISSISNFETFQANRLKLRYKNKDGKNELAHTLNGSSLALPRVLAGILENYKTEAGIVIPDVLQSYTGFSIID